MTVRPALDESLGASPLDHSDSRVERGRRRGLLAGAGRRMRRRRPRRGQSEPRHQVTAYKEKALTHRASIPPHPQVFIRAG